MNAKELIDKHNRLVAEAKAKFPSAYAAGVDAARNGANTDNCHFAYFGSRESADEWERGNRDGKAYAG